MNLNLLFLGMLSIGLASCKGSDSDDSGAGDGVTAISGYCNLSSLSTCFYVSGYVQDGLDFSSVCQSPGVEVGQCSLGSCQGTCEATTTTEGYSNTFKTYYYSPTYSPSMVASTCSTAGGTYSATCN